MSILKYRISAPTASPLAFMNVSGFPSSTAVPSGCRIFVTRASAGDDSKVAECRRASSSATAKPMLWRVPRYFAPGLPSPTISFIRI